MHAAQTELPLESSVVGKHALYLQSITKRKSFSVHRSNSHSHFFFFCLQELTVKVELFRNIMSVRYANKYRHIIRYKVLLYLKN